MKVYICRRGKPDFVCHADTVADAIICLWLVTRELPKASYRVHFGRRRQSRTVSSAVAYWRLDDEMRSRLYDVLESTSTETQFGDFCEIAVQAALLLGK
jgi:hypothetical protein